MLLVLFHVGIASEFMSHFQNLQRLQTKYLAEKKEIKKGYPF